MRISDWRSDVCSSDLYKARPEEQYVAPVAKPKLNLQKPFLRYWRRHAKLSQESAADQLNVSRGLLSQLENAKTPYTQRVVEQAAKVYDCSPAEIIAGPGCIDLDLLANAIETVDEICVRMRLNADSAEKANMTVSFYRESLQPRVT